MHQEIIIAKMKGWKIGGIVGFSLVTLVYGIIIYVLANQGKTNTIFSVLKTYPVIILIFVPIAVIIGLIASAITFFLKPKKKTRKKGQIWVSTVLYIALSIVAMTLILAAGIPMITRMKDRNTFIESKTMMHVIDGNINTVVSEGPGSRRVLDPVIIKGGKLFFDIANDEVRWEMKTGTMLMEPCPFDEVSGGKCPEKYIQSEGSLKFYLIETMVVDEYIVNILLDYKNKVDLVYSKDNEITGSLTGNYVVAITNEATTEGVKVGILVN